MKHHVEKLGQKKARIGIVVSDCQDKTIIVRVERRTAHKRYGKVITRSKKYYAHDEHNNARIGNEVRILETRPLSKLKRWRLVEILSQSNN